MTIQILFIEHLSSGWKLFGKIDWSGSTSKPDDKNKLGWLIGWVEKGDDFLSFAYNIANTKLIFLKATWRRAKKEILVLATPFFGR